MLAGFGNIFLDRPRDQRQMAVRGHSVRSEWQFWQAFSINGGPRVVDECSSQNVAACTGPKGWINGNAHTATAAIQQNFLVTPSITLEQRDLFPRE